MPYTLTRHPFPPAVRELRLGARTILARDGVERYVRLRFVASRPGGLAGFIAPGGGDHATARTRFQPSGWPASIASGARSGQPGGVRLR